MEDYKKCAREECDVKFVPRATGQKYCSDRCGSIHRHRVMRAEAKGTITQKLTQIRCARYGCEEWFVPKSIQNRFHSSACSALAKDQQKVLSTIEHLDDVDPVDIRARKDPLVLEIERQREILMRALVKEQSRTEVVVTKVKDWMDNPENHKPLFVTEPWPTAGMGRPTEAHLLFSDPQCGKWENGIGVQVLLENYMPKLIDAVKKIIAVQRNEGPVDTFYLHLLGDIIENCLPAGTIVTTPSGPKYIEDIVVGDMVWAHDDGGFKQAPVTASKMTGIKPIHTIVSTERTLRASPGHPFLVRRDVEVSGHQSPNRYRYEVQHAYVEAKDIKPGDYLCIMDQLPDVGNNHTPDGSEATISMMEFLGFYVGDGCLTKSSTGKPNGVYLAHDTKNAPYMPHYQEVSKDLFTKQGNVAVAPAPARGGTRFGSVQAANSIIELGFGGYSQTKRVPAWVFSLSRELRLAFLRGYLDSDGMVNKLGQMQFGTVNKGLLEDVQTLCMGLGLLTSRIKPVDRIVTTPGGAAVESRIWIMNCGSSDLNNEVGSYTPMYIDRWENRKGVRRVRNYRVCDKGRVPEAPAGCRYSIVKSNTVGDSEPVFNITVEGLHTFIADGVVSHNCIIYPGQRQYLDRHLSADSTVDQVMIMARAIENMINTLLPHFKRFVVANAFGNHGRTSKKDDPNLDKDNYDRLIALILREYFRDTDIEFVIPDEDRYMVKSYGWRIGGIHGHQLNGKGSLNAMETVILRWDAAQHFTQSLDIMVMGHRHHAASLDINGIEVIQNATMDGGSPHFANTTGKQSAPSQEFFFISEEYGIDSRHRIYLDERKPRTTKMLEALLAE